MGVILPIDSKASTEVWALIAIVPDVISCEMDAVSCVLKMARCYNTRDAVQVYESSMLLNAITYLLFVVVMMSQSDLNSQMMKLFGECNQL